MTHAEDNGYNVSYSKIAITQHLEEELMKEFPEKFWKKECKEGYTFYEFILPKVKLCIRKMK